MEELQAPRVPSKPQKADEPHQKPALRATTSAEIPAHVMAEHSLPGELVCQSQWEEEPQSIFLSCLLTPGLAVPASSSVRTHTSGTVVHSCLRDFRPENVFHRVNKFSMCGASYLVTSNAGKTYDWAGGKLQRAQQVAAECRAACDMLKGAPKSSRDDPFFMDNYYKASRLHFIGTWKTRIEALAAKTAGGIPWILHPCK